MMKTKMIMINTWGNTKSLSYMNVKWPYMSPFEMGRSTQRNIVPLTLFHNRLPSDACLRCVAKGSEGDNSDGVKMERGVKFITDDTFYREESSIGRDLGVLAAALYKKKNGKLRVLDAMCGCGVRTLRYLAQANADFVWANDANEYTLSTILTNLSQLQGLQAERGQFDDRKWIITHNDANRLITDRYLQEDYYDFIDIDSFGSSSSFLGSALCAVRYGGLLYLTSTDGFCAGGHRPHKRCCTRSCYS
eukprot:Gb_28063 [translate_table: standard]